MIFPRYGGFHQRVDIALYIGALVIRWIDVSLKLDQIIIKVIITGVISDVVLQFAIRDLNGRQFRHQYVHFQGRANQALDVAFKYQSTVRMLALIEIPLIFPSHTSYCAVRLKGHMP